MKPPCSYTDPVFSHLTAGAATNFKPGDQEFPENQEMLPETRYLCPKHEQRFSFDKFDHSARILLDIPTVPIPIEREIERSTWSEIPPYSCETEAAVETENIEVVSDHHQSFSQQGY